MTPEVAKILREPFPAEVVGKLPRIWCKACSDAAKARRTCDEHRKVRCPDCRNNITEAHLHLDYVGHAETTDRFLQADPEWTWEPLAFGADGLPQFDRNGGLWIRLTIAGTSRLGYGAAQGKEGPDAVKEVIGDALRNSGMRFGVALDLWGAKFKDTHDDEPEDREPTASDIRSAIAKVGAAKGMLPDAIAGDFEAWSTGGHIGVTEDTGLLGDYLSYLQDKPPKADLVAAAFDQHKRGVGREGELPAPDPRES